MIEREEIVIDCLRDEKRNLTVYVPENEGTFPVLYMMDGQNVFFDEDATYGKSWGMYDFLLKNNPGLIVVAIDSSRGKNNERLFEYAPYDFIDYKYGKIHGEAKKFLRWILDTLKPYIDSKYPTMADRYHTYIAGSSMGGLVSYYALLKYNDVFRCAACLSPSLWVANDKLLKLTKRASIKDDSIIYLDYGSLEAGNNKFAKRSKESFWNCVAALKDKPINLNVRVIQNSGHNEASWQKQAPLFIELFLKEVD